MKKFLAIYIGTAAALEKSKWNEMDAAKRQALEKSGIAAWGKWMADHHASIVEPGGPLGKTKRTSPRGLRISRTA